MNLLSRRTAAMALAAVLAAGCSSSPTPSATRAPADSASAAQAAAAHGVEAPADAVPWSDVGGGWMLAMWSEAAPEHPGGEPVEGEPSPFDSPTTLYLVNPEGGRYPITTFPAPGENGVTPSLVDWSGDGTRALVYQQGPEDGTVIQVDLRSGKQTSFPVERGFDITPRFSRPGGKAILLLKDIDVDGPASLTRVDLAGKQQLTYPVGDLESKFNAAYISSPDGTQLVLGTGSGLAMMGNDGTPGKALPVPDASDCRPMRWWDTNIAVAQCYGPDFSYSRLWLVPVDGGAPTPLTAQNNGQQGEDLADQSAWKLPSGTFLQALGPCGYRYLAELDPADGTTTKVSVPKVDEHSSVYVLGANNGHLQLQAALSCGSGQSLLDYDPAAGKSTVLLGGEVNGGGVEHAVPYPGFD